MSEMPQAMPQCDESAGPHGRPAGKLMETKWILNRRGWPLKLGMLVLLVALWCWNDQIDTWLHEHKEAAYEYDVCIQHAHGFMRNAWMVALYVMVWLIMVIDEWRARKWFWSALMAFFAEIYYYSVLLPCGNLVGVCFWILMAGSFAVMVKSSFKAVRVYLPPDELLGRGKVYGEILEHLLGALSAQDRGTSMAIVGNWGTGKSHCLQHLKNKLTQGCKGRVYRVCEVDLWQVSNLNEGLAAVASELEFALTGRDKPNSNSLVHIVKIGLQGIFASTGVSESYFNEIIDYIGDEGNASKGLYAKKFGKKIKQECGDGGIVLIIDNVERAADEVLLNMLPLVDKLKEISQLAIVCAINAKALENRNTFRMNRVSADGYLSKLFDDQYVLPEITEHGMARMLDFYFKRYGMRERVKNFILANRILFESPRQIERAIAHLCYVDKHFIDGIESQHAEYSQAKVSEKDDDAGAKELYIAEWKDDDYTAADVFFVSLLQLLYKGICDEIAACDNLQAYREGFDFIKYRHAHRKEVAPSLQMELALSRSINDDAYKWEERNPVSAELVKNDCLAWSLLRGIDSMEDGHYMYCIERRYERNERLSQEDAARIIEAYAHDRGEIDELIMALGEVSTPDNIAHARRFLLSYASHHLDELKDGVCFLHKMVNRICNPTTSDSFDMQTMRQYAASQIFFRPLLVNFARLNLSESQRRQAHDVCECIISLMSFKSLCSMVSDLYSALHRPEHKLYVHHYYSMYSIDIGEYLTVPVIADCEKMLAKHFVATIHREFDGQYAFERFSNIDNYQYFDKIEDISTDLIDEYNPTLPPAGPQIWARRLSCILKYISHKRMMMNGEGLAFDACYVSPNHLALLEKHLNHIVANHLVSNCDPSQLTELKQLAEESLTQLNEGLRLIDEHSFHFYIEPQHQAIHLLTSCRDYLHHL